MRHQDAVDKKVAHALNEAHRKTQKNINARRKAKEPFADGSWVWLLSLKKVGGHKIERWWKGPFQVVQRTGDASFQIRTDLSVLYDVHRDQLKPCVWDVELGESYPLVFRASDPADQRTTAPVVDRVMDHRKHPTRGLEFLVHWVGKGQDFSAWEPAGSFLNSCPDPWLTYCHRKNLCLDIPRVVEALGKAPEVLPEPDDE